MTGNGWEFDSWCEADTARLGAALAGALEAGGAVALHGTLGAGKTRLVQGLAEALGVPRGDVVSPTFVLVQEYPGRLLILHVDAYRLRDADEYVDLGLDERLGPGVLLLVEWADRVAEVLPAERLEVSIAVTGEESRRFEVRALGGPRYAPVVAALRGECGG